MDTLSTLFGSTLRVKMMRLFLFNPDSAFDVEHIRAKTDAKPRDIEKEVAAFKKIGLVRQSKLIRLVSAKKGKKVVEKKKKVKAFSLDSKFEFREELSDFLVRTHSLENRTIVKKLEKAGRIKAVLVSGIFMKDADARIDLFVVGDNVKASALERVVRGIESDMGKDIRYSVLSAPDFAYRKSMNDKLIRDVLDYPHTILVDKIGIARA
ncbi:MAG: hypothetical protein HZA81_03890 [Candidatus Taylorbacteria bacterium]|nr:hypothetical protein [Candidatus Taylorbacteria bacterium]